MTLCQGHVISIRHHYAVHLDHLLGRCLPGVSTRKFPSFAFPCFTLQMRLFCLPPTYKRRQEGLQPQLLEGCFNINYLRF